MRSSNSTIYLDDAIMSVYVSLCLRRSALFCVASIYLHCSCLNLPCFINPHQYPTYEYNNKPTNNVGLIMFKSFSVTTFHPFTLGEQK